MGDLAKFFADIIEFIVGGVFFVASLLFVVFEVAPATYTSLTGHLDDAPDSLSGVYPIAALAVVYAMGIFAEGISRLLCEWELTRLTKKHDLAGYADDESDPVKRREKWRTRAMADSPSLTEKVNGQLKRLRIERTLVLSALLTLVAAAWGHRGSLVVVVGVLLVLTCVLVDVRFRRFLDTIVDAYEASGGVLLPRTPPETTTAPTGAKGGTHAATRGPT